MKFLKTLSFFHHEYTKNAGNANCDTGTFAWLSVTFHNIMCFVFLLTRKTFFFLFLFVIYTYNWKYSIWRPVRLFHISMDIFFLYFSLFRLVIHVSYKCIYVSDCIHVRDFYFHSSICTYLPAGESPISLSLIFRFLLIISIKLKS